MTASIRVNELRKTFVNSVVALDGVSFDVEPGEFVSLLGPSGCGKTTMLRSIAGLEEPDSGVIAVTGRTVFSSTEPRKLSLPPEKRGLSMVFQQYALWPHMTVFGNVAFGLSMRGASKNETEAKVKRALDRVQLLHVRDRRISALSGGQQQRIALARAIAFDPDVILFDEPLSNLDANLREEMRLQLQELQSELRFTALYVTHDQAEAMSLSNRILVMNHGRVEQNGTPQEIWESPGTAFVARFVGSSNIFRGIVAESAAGRSVVQLGDSGLTCIVPDDLRPGDDVELFIRFHDILVSRTEPQNAGNVWPGTVGLLSYEGHQTVVKLTVSGVEIVALVPSSLHLASGESVFVSMAEHCVRAFAAAPGGETTPTIPEPVRTRG